VRASGGGPGCPPHGQAVLIALPIHSTRALRFGRQTRFWQPLPFVPSWGILQRRAGGRIALVPELGRERTRLGVYNVHLESRGFGITRLAQLRELLADARGDGPDLPVVIAGDLNTKYRPGLFGSMLAREGCRNCGMRTHVVIGALDWVSLRGRASCADTTVVRGTRGSDHDPLVAEIRLE
jgi:endonuclease/exonuclease/phosphatase family metal-dependent hydrolase